MPRIFLDFQDCILDFQKYFLRRFAPGLGCHFVSRIFLEKQEKLLAKKKVDKSGRLTGYDQFSDKVMGSLSMEEMEQAAQVDEDEEEYDEDEDDDVDNLEDLDEDLFDVEDDLDDLDSSDDDNEDDEDDVEIDI